MLKILLESLKKNWRDVAAATVAVGLILTSTSIKYELGMLIGFIILFVFFSFERIKRIIFDMRVRKIFGIEFGEIDENLVKEGVRKDVEKRGIKLSDEEVDELTDVALNRISGVATKAATYEQIVQFALTDLSTPFVTNLSWATDAERFSVDFVIDLDGSRVLGIEVAYSESRFLSANTIDQVIRSCDAFKSVDNVSHFVLITNTSVRDDNKNELHSHHPSIDVIERVISPDGVLSAFRDYFVKIDRTRRGSFECAPINGLGSINLSL